MHIQNYLLYILITWYVNKQTINIILSLEVSLFDTCLKLVSFFFILTFEIKVKRSFYKLYNYIKTYIFYLITLLQMSNNSNKNMKKTNASMSVLFSFYFWHCVIGLFSTYAFECPSDIFAPLFTKSDLKFRRIHVLFS